MKRHLIWIGELFVWILILSLISGSIMLAKYTYKSKFNTYQIFLPDIDGLINGSPVRFLGITVGYVNQVNIVGEDVYVKFIITDRNLKIPKGTVATVEFSGLGGSKSLELYPPGPDSMPQDKIIIAQRPKRIHDSLGLLSEMYDTVSGIIYEVSSFMDQVGIIKTKNEGQSDPAISFEKILKDSNDWLDDANGTEKNLRTKLNGNKGAKHEPASSKSDK